MLAGRPLDVFDDLLARALLCLSHRPLLGGYDEQQTLSYQIRLIGPISADARHLKLYEAEGLEVQTRILGNLLGYYQVEFGPQNQIVHMWGYTDLADRTKRRGELVQDPDWKSYVPKIRPLVRWQENKLLLPAPFMQTREA